MIVRLKYFHDSINIVVIVAPGHGFFYLLSMPNFLYRSSLSEVFCKKGVLRNFTKFTVKHMCQSLFFNKVAGLRPATLLKKRLWHRCFPVNFVKFLRTFFFHRTPLVAAFAFNIYEMKSSKNTFPSELLRFIFKINLIRN